MKSRSKRRPKKGQRIDPIALAAREQISRAVDDLLEKFIGTRAVKEVQRSSLQVPPTWLETDYQRLRATAQALMRWHSDENYLTSDGNPKPLRRTGLTSLLSLTRAVTSRPRQATRLCADLIELGFVARDGVHFVPSKRSAVLGEPSAMILAHATAAIIHLVGTVAHNIGGGVPPRYERHVADVRIRSADLPIFLRFVEEQGQYLIDSVDDWLSKRELTGPAREKEVAVGIGTFAWADLPKRRAATSTRGGAIVPRK